MAAKLKLIVYFFCGISIFVAFKLLGYADVSTNSKNRSDKLIKSGF